MILAFAEIKVDKKFLTLLVLLESTINISSKQDICIQIELNVRTSSLQLSLLIIKNEIAGKDMGDFRFLPQKKTSANKQTAQDETRYYQEDKMVNTHI